MLLENVNTDIFITPIATWCLSLYLRKTHRICNYGEVPYPLEVLFCVLNASYATKCDYCWYDIKESKSSQLSCLLYLRGPLAWVAWLNIANGHPSQCWPGSTYSNYVDTRNALALQTHVVSHTFWGMGFFGRTNLGQPPWLRPCTTKPNRVNSLRRNICFRLFYGV